ncbi:MAG: bifunctional oligoribonuclease/PAP phosphatase NrnA [Deltaproteobacteria bacterium]|nr:bifunctional oligoribonuclease/PAP phosphatase NrnA [Deltaproteobacteria bacterium]MCL5277113.1 bifunctional oligoribonuclease/PAP phosphatase NrnA [Deltaproteobacteria bacterium]
MIDTKSVNELKSLIRNNTTFFILSHVNPEPDTIGAALSLYHYLKGIDKRPVVYNADGIPGFMKFMQYSDVIRTAIPHGKFDIAISVDAGGLDMLGDDFDKLKRDKTVNIDHHRTNTMFGDLNIVDPCASAVCELLYTLFKKMGIRIDGTISSLLLTGIIYDTGSFRYRNTTARTLRIASELVKRSHGISDIAERLYENQSIGRLRLIEKMIDTIELSMDGRIASSVLTRDMYDATGTTREDAEGLIDYPKSISGVAVAVLFRETEDNRYKVSLRSKSNVDVAEIAEKFGGGGHTNAAGFTVSGRLMDIKNEVLNSVLERLT